MIGGQGARRQRLQHSDEAHPDGGQHAEGDIVGHQSLQVAQRRLGNGEDADADNRDRERGDVGLQ